MKRLLIVTLMLMALLFGVASCDKDEPDGKWPKMQWEVPDGIVDLGGAYVVPASGATYKFTCTNYKPWIANIVEAVEDTVQMATLNDFYFCEGSWYCVKCTGNDVIVTFKPRPADDYNHILMVTLTAGDIFDYFAFIQNPRILD
jgi:hypothetical protein